MTEVDDPLVGQFLDYEFPVMMSKTPPKVKWSVRPVGFDNEYIMTHRLGKSEDEIKALYECGALGKWPMCEDAGRHLFGMVKPG